MPVVGQAPTRVSGPSPWEPGTFKDYLISGLAPHGRHHCHVDPRCKCATGPTRVSVCSDLHDVRSC